MEALKFMGKFGFDEARDVFWPLHVLQIFVIIKVEVVEFSVMQLGIQHLSDQLVNIFDLAIDVLLKHSEPFRSVEDLERCHPTQELH